MDVLPVGKAAPTDAGIRHDQRVFYNMMPPIQRLLISLILALALLPACQRPQPKEPKAARPAIVEELDEGDNRVDPVGILSCDQWDRITGYPYARQPFVDNARASRRYFEAFLACRRKQWEDPGGLYLGGFPSQTRLNAAWVAGWGAGATGQWDQLTPDELAEIGRARKTYDPDWPFDPDDPY